MDGREPQRLSASQPPNVVVGPSSYGAGATTNSSIVSPDSGGMFQGMRLSFRPMTSSEPKQVDMTGSLYQGDGLSGVRQGGVLNLDEPMKKKRGRPRKYGADGAMSLGLTPSSASGYSNSAGSDPTAKRRGRPPGSGKKQQLDALGTPGIGFTPHVISVKVGEVYGDEEWSFGFCEQGSGVFSCPPGRNPMYTYRERIVLGETDCSIFKVNQILRELSRSWPGQSYDLLSKNCNHFCDTFCEKLGVPKLPGWINRFANAGDTAVVVAGNAAFRLRQAKQEIVSASKVAYRFMAGLASNPNSEEGTPESPSNSNRGSPRFQGAWFKNLTSIGAKPSTSTSDLAEESNDVPIHHQQHSEAATQFKTK